MLMTSSIVPYNAETMLPLVSRKSRKYLRQICITMFLKDQASFPFFLNKELSYQQIDFLLFSDDYHRIFPSTLFTPTPLSKPKIPRRLIEEFHFPSSPFQWQWLPLKKSPRFPLSETFLNFRSGRDKCSQFHTVFYAVPCEVHGREKRILKHFQIHTLSDIKRFRVYNLSL